MTRTIDIPTFQAAVVRNCSPTLAGIKPASLFTYPGVYAHQDGSGATAPITDRRVRLLNVIAQCNRELDQRAKTALAKEGYDTDNLPLCLAHLASRITLASNNAAECACGQTRCALDHQANCSKDCTCELPHEIGYFLGYPYDDVHEFIVQRGENYKIFGAWKVYANVEQALATFDAYRACTQYFTFVYQQGCSLAQLAQATR